MITWLIQTIADHPALGQGLPPAGLLTERERLRFAELKTPKRRGDWLIGRWTAKHLLQFYIEQRTGIRLQLNMLTMANDPDGAPRVIGDWRLGIGHSHPASRSRSSNLESLNLSISHCDGQALCAVTDTRG